MKFDINLISFSHCIMLSGDRIDLNPNTKDKIYRWKSNHCRQCLCSVFYTKFSKWWYASWTFIYGTTSMTCVFGITSILQNLVHIYVVVLYKNCVCLCPNHENFNKFDICSNSYNSFFSCNRKNFIVEKISMFLLVFFSLRTNMFDVKIGANRFFLPFWNLTRDNTKTHNTINQYCILLWRQVSECESTRRLNGFCSFNLLIWIMWRH